MLVVILIPAFNEEQTIGKLIKEICEQEFDFTHRIVVINDGSKDNTAKVSMDSGADFVLNNKKNSGKARSVNFGFVKALELGADIIVTIDADLQHDPSEINKLVEPIINDNSDFTIGNRFNSLNDNNSMTFLHRFGNYLFTTIVNIVTRSKFSDTQCGFRAYSREAALNLNLKARGNTSPMQEEIIELSYKGLIIEEVDLHKVPGVREIGKSRMIRNPFSYGLLVLSLISMTVKNYYPLRFFGFFSVLALFFSFLTGIIIMSTDPNSRPENFTWLSFEYTLVSLILGLFLLVIGIFADTSSNIKSTVDKTLYYSKKTFFDSKKNK